MVVFSDDGLGKIVMSAVELISGKPAGKGICPQYVIALGANVFPFFVPLTCNTGIFLPLPSHLYSIGLDGKPIGNMPVIIESTRSIDDFTRSTSKVPAGVVILPHPSTSFTRF